MPLYMCRWPNGDLSFVSARNKTEAVAIGRLDEFDACEESWLIQVPDFFMLDFRLDDVGRLELQQIGEELEEFIYSKAYPALSDVVLSHNGAEEQTDAYLAALREAVQKERERLDQGEGSRTSE